MHAPSALLPENDLATALRQERAILNGELVALEALDEEINGQLRRMSGDLAWHYLAIGTNLNLIHEVGGWRTLGYRSWTKYLESKRELFGRSMIFSIAKLGRADREAIEIFLDKGLQATKLLEIARVSVEPHEIPRLLELTWEESKVLSARQLAKVAKRMVDEWHADDPQPPRGAGRRRDPMKKMEKLLAGMTEGEREAFLGDVKRMVGP